MNIIINLHVSRKPDCWSISGLFPATENDSITTRFLDCCHKPSCYHRSKQLKNGLCCSHTQHAGNRAV